MTRLVRPQVGARVISVSSDYRPAILGFSLSFMMFLQVLGQGSPSFIQASSLSLLIVGFLIAISYPVTNKLNTVVVALIVSLGFMIVIGAFRAAEYLGNSVFLRAAGVLLFLSLGLLLARRKEHFLFERAFPIYAVTFVGVLIYVLIDNDRHWDRLRGHLHSNLWAFVAATAVVGIMAARTSAFIRAALIGFVLYMIAIQFQARGPLIWAVLTILLFSLTSSLRRMRSSNYPLLYLSGYIFVFVLGALAFLFAVDFIFFDILQIDSATRGIGSGFTGRGAIWMEYLALVADNPIFGHGFDMSRYVAEFQLAGYVAGDISSAHNSYLTILYDHGLIGFLVYSALLIMMLLGAIRSGRGQLTPFIVAFILIGLTESRPLNVGNPSGLLFVLLIPYCAASAFGSSRRVTRKHAMLSAARRYETAIN